MDKIDSVGESFSNKSLQKKTRKKKTAAVGPFTSLFTSAAARTEEVAAFDAEEEPAGPLEGLLEDVTDAGEALVQTPTLENVARYRGKVKHFLRYLVDHVLEVREQTSGANILKRKKYTLIRAIDEKLEFLAREFLNRQKAQIDILGRINEINGLLIDLMR